MPINITVSPHPVRTKPPQEPPPFTPQEFDVPMRPIPITPEAKPKIHQYGESLPLQFWFNCPGCRNTHAFTVGPPQRGPLDPRWTFNGSFDRPTFSPSLLCNKDHAPSRCHLFLENGRIRFLDDCHHALAGKTVECPDWEE